ncbi:hypothetical protein C8J57DRAFT_1299893 [Mycena rebaudengoi]|nr:hypothetical protein C8J57DRAFT_1299893 [Mycena rebaudengoi]
MTPFNIQELCDRIISHLAAGESSRDLNSAALVSSAFCSSAQPHIFHDVFLHYDSITVGSDRPFDAIAACGRLCAVVTHSPYLIKYIRRLSTRVKPELLAPLSKIPFSHLRDIYFQEIGDVPHPDLVRHFTGLPSIRSVGFLGRPSTLSADLLAAIFETSSPEIMELMFHIVTFSPASSNITVPFPRQRRAMIQKLELCRWDEDPSIIQWLISPSCPLDLSKLVDVAVEETEFASNEAIALINPSRETITRLGVDSGMAVRLPLYKFTALTRLEISVSGDALWHLQIAISRLPADTRIEAIVFRLKPISLRELNPLLIGIDPLIANHPFPSLRCVEFQGFDAPDVAFVGFKTHLPLLHARNVLHYTRHTFRNLTSRFFYPSR